MSKKNFEELLNEVPDQESSKLASWSGGMQELEEYLQNLIDLAKNSHNLFVSAITINGMTNFDERYETVLVSIIDKLKEKRANEIKVPIFWRSDIPSDTDRDPTLCWFLGDVEVDYVKGFLERRLDILGQIFASPFNTKKGELVFLLAQGGLINYTESPKDHNIPAKTILRYARTKNYLYEGIVKL